MRIRSISLALAVTAAVAMPAAAFAARAEAATAGVQYKDLDLATEAGKKQLEIRLDKAARQVCGMDEVMTGSRVRSKEARECYRGAREQLGASLAQLVKNNATGG